MNNQSMTTKLLEKISKIYAEKGIGGVVKKICHRAIPFLFETNSAVWHVKVIDRSDYLIDPAIPLTVEFEDFYETLSWIELQNIPWRNEKEDHLAIDQCHYWPNVNTDGLIIGYLKLGYGSVYISDYGKTIEFPRNTAYIYDTFVLPEFRNKKVASYLINETCKFLKNKGFRKVICHIPAWNIPSLRIYSEIGFVRKKEIRWIKIFGLQILTSNPGNL